jgi:hypothetical protein
MQFNSTNPFVKNDEKKSLSDDMIKAMFLLLDTDESGELEPEEILGVL